MGNRSTPPSGTQRFGVMIADAVPDAAMAVLCIAAWAAPARIPSDLVLVAGAAYAIELPLALLLGFVGVRRVQSRDMRVATKFRFIALPTTVFAFFALLVCGPQGLFAVAWLGGRSVWTLLREGVDRSAAVRGLWLVYSRTGNGTAFQMTAQPPPARPGQWVVPAGHDQLLAMLTVAVWTVVAALLLMLPFPAGDADATLSESIGWTLTLLGQALPLHLALAGGAMLFAARTLAHFEGRGDAPPPRAEDDALLREIIARVDGEAPVPEAKRRPRRRRNR